MLMIGHTAIGIVTGLFIPDPIAAFFVGVVTHHLADMSPHFDQGSLMDPELRKSQPIHKWSKRDVVMLGVDMALTAGLVGYAFTHVSQQHWTSMGAGIVGANFPDLVHNVPFWNKQTRKVFWIRWWQDNIHRKYHWPVSLSLWYLGVAPQLLVVGLAIWTVSKRG